jgi:hypothetical protein
VFGQKAADAQWVTLVCPSPFVNLGIAESLAERAINGAADCDGNAAAYEAIMARKPARDFERNFLRALDRLPTLRSFAPPPS